jgi:hypothetical protein
VSTGAGTGTTAGTTSAADDARIRALRSRVYGPDATQVDIAALAEALAAVAPPSPPALDEAVESARQPAAAPAAPAAPAPPQPATALAVLRRVPPRLVVGMVAVAALGALAGAGTAAVAAGTGSADPRAVPSFSATIDVPAPAGVLARPARSGDHPTALVGPDLVNGSFRRLAAYPAAGVTLWAARDRFGQTCLVVADTYYRTACADAATVAKDGLVIGWSGGPGYPASTTESYTALWRAGRLTAGRSAP